MAALTAKQNALLRREPYSDALTIAPSKAIAMLSAAGFTGTIPPGTLFLHTIPNWERGRLIAGTYCKGPCRGYLLALPPAGGIMGHGYNGLPSIQLSGPDLAPGQRQGTQAQRFKPRQASKPTAKAAPVPACLALAEGLPAQPTPAQRNASATPAQAPLASPSPSAAPPLTGTHASAQPPTPPNAAPLAPTASELAQALHGSRTEALAAMQASAQRTAAAA